VGSRIGPDWVKWAQVWVQNESTLFFMKRGSRGRPCSSCFERRGVSQIIDQIHPLDAKVLLCNSQIQQITKKSFKRKTNKQQNHHPAFNCYYKVINQISVPCAFAIVKIKVKVIF